MSLCSLHRIATWTIVCLLFNTQVVDKRVLHVIFRMNGLCDSACIRKPQEHFLCALFSTGYRLFAHSVSTVVIEMNLPVSYLSDHLKCCILFLSYLRRFTHTINRENKISNVIQTQTTNNTDENGAYVTIYIFYERWTISFLKPPLFWRDSDVILSWCHSRLIMKIYSANYSNYTYHIDNNWQIWNFDFIYKLPQDCDWILRIKYLYRDLNSIICECVNGIGRPNNCYFGLEMINKREEGEKIPLKSLDLASGWI